MWKGDCWHPSRWMRLVHPMAYSLLEFHGLLGRPMPKADGVLGRPKLLGCQTGVLGHPLLTAGVLGQQLPLVHPTQLAHHVLLTRHLPTRHLLGRHLLGRHLPGRPLPGRHLLACPQPLTDPSLMLGRRLQLQVLLRDLVGPAKWSLLWLSSLGTG